METRNDGREAGGEAEGKTKESLEDEEALRPDCCSILPAGRLYSSTQLSELVAPQQGRRQEPLSSSHSNIHKEQKHGDPYRPGMRARMFKLLHYSQRLMGCGCGPSDM